MHPRHGASPRSSPHRRGRSGQTRWLSMAVARMLSELFPCSPAPREVSRNTPDTGLWGPSAPPWPQGSVALRSHKLALLPPFGTYSKRNTYFLYFARYFHSQPILTSPCSLGFCTPGHLIPNFPRAPISQYAFSVTQVIHMALRIMPSTLPSKVQLCFSSSYRDNTYIQTKQKGRKNKAEIN